MYNIHCIYCIKAVINSIEKYSSKYYINAISLHFYRIRGKCPILHSNFD